MSMRTKTPTTRASIQSLSACVYVCVCTYVCMCVCILYSKSGRRYTATEFQQHPITIIHILNTAYLFPVGGGVIEDKVDPPHFNHYSAIAE